MTASWIVYACLAVGLSSALVGGVFQSFSDFVMQGLTAAKPAGGMESMQMINRTVFRSVFLVMLLGLVPVMIGFAAYACFGLAGPARAWILAGAAVYVAGVFLVTMAGNVPMNNRLDVLDPLAAEAGAYWQTYGRVWTGWNHVRTLASVAAAACFLMAGTALA